MKGMAKDPSKKYSIMQEMRKYLKPQKPVSGAGARRDKQLLDAEEKALNIRKMK